ncbi:MAG TPA: hypothetical protein VFJ16_22215 [Longimicrobium sp.]|nr:hypothetical protein [Longimicrobium sp.]
MPTSLLAGSWPALRSRLARAARRLRNRADRALHPRRRAAAARLGSVRPAAVLFICQGNIYRSPYAAGALARSLPRELWSMVEIASAGFVGGGRPSPAAAVWAARARGVDLSAHVSRVVGAPLLDERTMVVVMEPRQRRELVARFGVPAARVRVLGDLDPRPITTRAIADPWGQGYGVLSASYDRIDRCTRALADALAALPAGTAAPAAARAGAAGDAAAPPRGRGGGWAIPQPADEGAASPAAAG